MVDLDDRYEWVEITTLGAPGPEYVQGRCLHLELVPVVISTGEQVARLCTTCDQQLPPG